MAVDWSTFWPDLLSAFIQGLIILGLGAMIAWFLTHNYQRRKDKKQVINQLIDEIQGLSFLLDETDISWKVWKENPNDFKNLLKTELHAGNAMNKSLIIEAKLDNWLPKFNKESFIEETIKEGPVERKYGDFTDFIIDYGDTLLDTINEKDTRNEKIDEIDELYRHAMRFILMMLYGLIRF